MKLVVMLLIFAGGVYFLVHRHQVEVRRQAQIAEQERKAKAAALEEAALKQAPERDHTIRLSQKTLQTLRELTEDPNEEVRYASAELLWQLQDEQVPNIIKRLLADETEPAIKQKVLKILAKDKSKLSLAIISSVISDYDKETRLKAVEALGSFSNKEAINALNGAMQDYDEGVRLKAIEAVNRIRMDIQNNQEQMLRGSEVKPLFKVE